MKQLNNIVVEIPVPELRAILAVAIEQKLGIKLVVEKLELDVRPLGTENAYVVTGSPRENEIHI